MKQPSLALRRRALLPAAAFGLLASRARAAEVAPGNVESALGQLDGIAQRAMAQTGIPGLAIGVVHRDRVVYLKGFGVRKVGLPDPVGPDTVFQLASVSKPIASTVVAALVGDGLVAWDDPIIKHFPSFQMHDPWVTRAITLRDMFCHRSGLPDHAGDLLEDIGYDRGEVLYRLRFQAPDSSFRSHYAYTNFGLTAAAVAAANAAGKSWEEVSAERLFRALGMRQTSYRFADFIAAPNRAYGHTKTDGVWMAKHTRDPDAQSPAGGACSSIRDTMAWLRLQLAGGRLDGVQVVDAAALDETHRPQMVSDQPKQPAADRAGFYGLGWNVGYDEQGRVRWGHSGAFDLGAATCVTLYPAEQIGIVALTNAQPVGVPEAVNQSFLELALEGRLSRDWLAFLGPIFAKMGEAPYGADVAHPPATPLPAMPADAYAGTFGNDLYGPIRIAPEAGVLVLRLGPKQPPLPLAHFDRDVFTYQPVGENAYGRSAVVFTIGADGRAEAVTLENLDLHGQGRFQRAPPDGSHAD